MKTISEELAEVLLPAIEHALQNAEPGPLTAELFGELLLTQSYTPSLVEPATDESRQRDPSRSRPWNARPSLGCILLARWWM